MPKRATKKYPPIKHLRNLSMIIVGTIIDCAGYLIFITPNDMVGSGVWGIAGIFNHFINVIPMGAFVAALNIPLLIWGWNKLSFRFLLYTLFAIFLQSYLLIFMGNFLPQYTENPLLACLFGGVLSGVGSALVVKFHGSGGGTDIIGIILHDKYDMSISSINLVVKVVVVSSSAFIFGFEPAMYTMVYMVVTASVFTKTLAGANRKRNMMIVTDKGPEIAEKIINETGRGLTVMRGQGGYTHHPKDVLFCVVSRFQLAVLKDIIRETDPNAFVCINEAYEVMGRFPKNKHFTPVKEDEPAVEQEDHLAEVFSHFEHISYKENEADDPMEMSPEGKNE